MIYQKGTILNIKGVRCEIIGGIRYCNSDDNYNTWEEYRMNTPYGERWLSIDDTYREYSISWADNSVNGYIGPEWHEVDRGTAVVKEYFGYVDVDPGEKAQFIEYEDASEDNILSMEMWSDGTEFSRGMYIDRNDIQFVEYVKPDDSKNKRIMTLVYLFMFSSILFCFFGVVMSGSNKGIEKYLDNSSNYSYVTSITGNEKQKAKVFEYKINTTTDYVAENIIRGIDGNTESVTQNDNLTDQDIAIVTKSEYCLIYHPEDDPSKVYIQISSRKYNYTSNNDPYRCSARSARWYRSHYYSSSYSRDSVKYKKYSSSYKSYQGDTIHNIGNGYFDSYSNSVRQSSVNKRTSSGGGISGGK